MSYRQPWYTRIADRLTGRRSRLTEAYVARPQDLGWRSLSARLQDPSRFSSWTHRASIEAARYLHRYNPLARRLLELPIDFIVGEGVTVTATATDPEVRALVQGVIDGYWSDPINDLDRRLHTGLTRLLRDGEWIVPVFVNEVDGSVKLGTIDPLAVGEVIADPENYEQLRTLVVSSGTGGQPVGYDVVRVNELTGLLEGQAHYFTWNDYSDGGRGWSELTSMLDWIDAYDDGLLNAMRQVRFLTAWVWDVLIKGGTEEHVRKRRNEILADPPKPGSFQVHNDSEEWTPIAPALAGVAPTEQLRDAKLHIATGAGIPEHWLANGDAANRATAVAQNDPTFKQYARKQRLFRAVIAKLVQHAIDCRRVNGNVLTGLEPSDLTFDVTFPEMVPSDTASAAATLAQLVPALQAAEDSRWLSVDTSRKVVWNVVALLGVDVDPTAEATAIEQDALDALDRQAMADARFSPDYGALALPGLPDASSPAAAPATPAAVNGAA